MRLLRRHRTEPPPPPDAPPEEPAAEAPAPRLRFGGKGRLWLLVIVLILITVFALLLIRDVLPPQIVTWWPFAVAVPALIWFLASLVRRETRSPLGSTALLGLSVSMLLAAQNIASLSATWIGITFIAVGTGIVLRGLLLRHQPIG